MENSRSRVGRRWRARRVDVGDEEGEEEKDENDPESERKLFGWRRGVKGRRLCNRSEDRAMEQAISHPLKREKEKSRLQAVGRKCERLRNESGGLWEEAGARVTPFTRQKRRRAAAVQIDSGVGDAVSKRLRPGSSSTRTDACADEDEGWPG